MYDQGPDQTHTDQGPQDMAFNICTYVHVQMYKGLDFQTQKYVTLVLNNNMVNCYKLLKYVLKDKW